MIYCQKTLAGKPQLILEGEQESDVHALSIRTAGWFRRRKKQTTWTFEHAEVNTTLSSKPLNGQR